MPSKKEKVQDTKHSLTREPVGKSKKVYPDLSFEKENILSSSDDSPEKNIPFKASPRMTVKNYSSSSPDFMQDIANAARHRRGRRQQKQMNKSQDSKIQNFSPEKYSENSDVEMETNDFTGAIKLNKQRQETPKLDSPEDSTVDDPIRNQSMIRQSIENSDKTFHSCLEKRAMYLICIFILFCIIFIICYSYPFTSNENEQLTATNLVKKLKSEFKDQPPLTFRIIGSALKSVLEAQPKQPAIILLLATNGSETICREFAQSLVDSLSLPKYTIQISGESYKAANANHAKMEIDQIIEKELKIDQMGSVLIYDLDQIPGNAAIIFHKYYDHENAPFKKAVFVMTVNYKKPILNYSTQVWDKAANEHLLSVWTDAGVDQVTALLSRLAVSVALITTKPL